MRKRTLPKTKNSPKIKRERDPLPWRYCLLTIVCGFLLVAGFFFAARQHFSSIEYGIKNSKLKNQLEEIAAEKRRLLLEKEIALTPSEIKKAAKKLGFFEAVAENASYQQNQTKTEKSPADKTGVKKTIEEKPKQLVSNIVEAKLAKPEKDLKRPEKTSESKLFSKTGK